MPPGNRDPGVHALTRGESPCACQGVRVGPADDLRGPGRHPERVMPWKAVERSNHEIAGLGGSARTHGQSACAALPNRKTPRDRVVMKSVAARGDTGKLGYGS